MLLVAVARSRSEDSSKRYVLPVLWMMLCLHIMVHIQWLGGSGHQQTTRHPCLSDIDSLTGAFRGRARGNAPQDAKNPGCHIAMYVFGVSILGAFGVSAQFGPSNFRAFSQDLPVGSLTAGSKRMANHP